MIEPIENQGLLRQGARAAKAGDRVRARTLLFEAAQADPHNELTWLWLASVAEGLEDALEHLERALAINPFNQRARAWLTRVRNRMRLQSVTSDAASEQRQQAGLGSGPASAQPARSSWRCPICDQCYIAEPVRCVRCRAVQSLADLRPFFEDNPSDSDLLEASVARLENDVARRPIESHRALGLALLNLRRYRPALIHLSAAAALSPDDTALGKIAYDLMRRLNRDSSRSGEAQPNPCRHPA